MSNKHYYQNNKKSSSKVNKLSNKMSTLWENSDTEGDSTNIFNSFFLNTKHIDKNQNFDKVSSSSDSSNSNVDESYSSFSKSRSSYSKKSNNSDKNNNSGKNYSTTNSDIYLKEEI